YFAARKEEREEIDPQGYIEEGQGRDDDDRRQRERSERRGGSDGGAEAGGEETDGAVERSFETETETETEREKAMLSNSRAGAGPHIVVQSDEDEDEDDDDSALKRLVVTAQDGIQVEVGGITPDPSAPVSPAVIAVSAEGTSGNTSSSESTSATLTARTSASSGSSDDLDESGVATPRLGPRLDPGADQAIAFDDDGEAVRTPVAELISNPILNDGSALLYSPEAPLLVPLPELESPGAREGEEERSAADQVEAPLADGEDVTMGDSTARTSKKRSSAATKSGKTRRSRKNRSARNKEPLPNLCSHNHDTSVNHLATREILEALQLAELIILPYGVLVMYNFSAVEERQVIEDIVSSGGVRGALSPEDEETEAFHFCYDPAVPAPRIFNDFFTFRAPNHLLKLSLAHAIAQSTKLSVFEESMQRTLELTSHIPKELANTGELKLKRREALRLTGRLFKLRVDVNLTSNVASVPELFWSHATLKALYDPIRDYLEIDQRVENLNERLAVANDLLEIIHEDIANKAMSNITLIIIILILVACIVACGEISARLILHNRATSAAAAALRMLSSSSSSSTSCARAGLLLEAAAGAGTGAQKMMRVVPVKRMVTKSAAAWVRST
ncbi:Sad1-interacting factor 3, partial [Tilletia horrida]